MPSRYHRTDEHESSYRLWQQHRAAQNSSQTGPRSEKRKWTWALTPKTGSYPQRMPTSKGKIHFLQWSLMGILTTLQSRSMPKSSWPTKSKLNVIFKNFFFCLLWFFWSFVLFVFHLFLFLILMCVEVSVCVPCFCFCMFVCFSYLLSVYRSFICMYVYVACTCSDLRGQKRVSNPLELPCVCWELYLGPLEE